MGIAWAFMDYVLGDPVAILQNSAMPQLSIEYYNQALDAMQAGNAPEALAAIVNSLTEDPNDTETWQLYVIILTSLGRTEDARRATEKLKEKGFSEVDAMLLKAAAAASSGDFPTAIDGYESALALEPQRAEIRSTLALMWMQTGDHSKALTLATEAVAASPESANAHCALGRILRLDEKYEPALEALTKAVELDPDFMLALYEQGMLLSRNGDFVQALANFEKFLRHHPGDPSAIQAIEIVRKQM